MTNEETAALEAVILDVVNSRPWPCGSLAALSTEAIERWIAANGIDPECILVSLVYGVSETFGRLTDCEHPPFPSQRDDLVADLRAGLRALAADLADT